MKKYSILQKNLVSYGAKPRRTRCTTGRWVGMACTLYDGFHITLTTYNHHVKIISLYQLILDAYNYGILSLVMYCTVCYGSISYVKCLELQFDDSFISMSNPYVIPLKSIQSYINSMICIICCKYHRLCGLEELVESLCYFRSCPTLEPGASVCMIIV